MDTHAPATEARNAEPTRAYPPRFRWLKRGALAIVIAMIALPGLRVWWGHAADRRLQRMADAAHARGEPFWPQDFDLPPVPDAENAALTLRRAADALIVDSQYKAIDNGTLSNPPTEANIKELGAMMATNAKALQLSRQAGSQTKVDWGIRPRSPVMANYPPPNFLNEQRQLANLVAWTVIHDHATGDDAAAIERIQDLVHQAHVVDSAAPCMVTHLVCLGFTGLAADRIERIAPTLAVGPRTAAPATKPATRAQVQKLIAELLDEESFHAGASRSFYGERMVELDMIKHMADGYSDPWRSYWLIKPMFELDGLRVAQELTEGARAATQTNWPAARACITPAPPDYGSQIAQLTRFISITMAPPVKYALRRAFQAQSDRYAAATVLAIRLYRTDHQDRYPSSLGDLVPAYLPRLPADPMAGDGRSFGYKPNATPPVIYSVGEDGKDDGGTSLPVLKPRGDRWSQPDAVYPLIPTTQPASQNENDQ